MSSSSNNVDENNNNEINKNKEGDMLLWNFATHTHESYHDFTPKEAKEIRKRLLEWYRANRRKLPWRGDPPPYDGSTAGINSGSASSKSSSAVSSSKKKSSTTEKDVTSQKSITSFFNSSKIKKGDNATDTDCKSRNTITNDNCTSKSLRIGTRSSKRLLERVKIESVNNNDDEDNEDDTHKNDNDNRDTITPIKIEEEEGEKSNSASNDNNEDYNDNSVIPITGYSVWVSEIMLQQTRVEAVIPYYLKCKS